MTCDGARDLFSALVDDALSAEERHGLDAHLTGCADCRRELQAFQGTVALVRSARPVRAPIGFVDRVFPRARPAPWYRRLARRLFLPLRVKLPIEAAAVGVVAIIAVTLYRETPELQRAARQEASPPPVASDTPGPPAPPPPSSPPAEDARRTPEGTRPEPAAKPRSETDNFRSAESEVRGSEESKKLMKDEGGASRDRVAEQAREKSAAAPPPMAAPPPSGAPTSSAARLPSSARAAVDVAGRLAVTDRGGAESALADLVSRLGGVILARRSDADATVVDVRVPRAAYAELIQGLAGIGRWVPEHEVGELPDHVRVSFRLTV